MLKSPDLSFLKFNDGQMSPVAKSKMHQQCSGSIRTHKFIQCVQNIIGAFPKKSMRSIAKNIGVLEVSFRRAVHENLQYKFYERKIGQFISKPLK